MDHANRISVSQGARTFLLVFRLTNFITAYTSDLQLVTPCILIPGSVAFMYSFFSLTKEDLILVVKVLKFTNFWVNRNII